MKSFIRGSVELIILRDSYYTEVKECFKFIGPLILRYMYYTEVRKVFP